MLGYINQTTDKSSLKFRVCVKKSLKLVEFNKIRVSDGFEFVFVGLEITT